MAIKRILFILACVTCFWCQASFATERENCASNLSLLDTQMSEFEQRASDVFSLRLGVEVAAEDYTKCLEAPEIYDPFKDNCLSYETELSNRTREHESRTLELEVDEKMMIRKMKQLTNGRSCG